MRPPDETPFWQWLKDYLSFHSLEKKKIISFLVFIFVLSCVQVYLSFREPVRNLETIEFLGREHFKKLHYQIDSSESANSRIFEKPNKAEPQMELIPFDPNLTDSMGWRNLGLSPKQAQVIVRIRDERKGFKSKKELEKINILNRIFKDIEPYIQLPDTVAHKVWASNSYPKSEFYTDSMGPKWVKKEFEKLSIDLNKADTMELVKLYGIGPSFSKRIVKFRDALGGFHSKEQLLDVWGMDSARFFGIESEVFVETTQIRTININSATIEELKNHPYIEYKIARAITNYRQQHGPYGSTDELIDIHLIDQELLNRLKPYLATN